MFSHVICTCAVLPPGKGKDSATRVDLPSAVPGNSSTLTNQGKKMEEKKKVLDHPGPPGERGSLLVEDGACLVSHRALSSSDGERTRELIPAAAALNLRADRSGSKSCLYF